MNGKNDRPREDIIHKVSSRYIFINITNTHLPTIAGEPRTRSLWKHFFFPVTETTAYTCNYDSMYT